MKIIISTVIATLLSCVSFVYGQQNAPVSASSQVEQHNTSDQPNCTIPNNAIEVQLSDIQLIENNEKPSPPELDESFKEMQFKLSEEPILYVIYKGKCTGTFPVTKKDKHSITVSINGDDNGDILLYQMSFTPQ